MRHILGPLTLTLALVGCSSSTDDQADPDPAPSSDTAPTLPACDDVWQTGNTLPDDYEGCEDGDTIVAAVFASCPAGEEFEYTSYDDALFALRGGPVVETAGDAADLYADCQGQPRVTS